MQKTSQDIEMVRTDLQIDEQLDAHRRGWVAQRYGLVFIFSLILLAAIGIFGDGITSSSRESTNSVTVESERFYRFEARMELKIAASNSAEGEVTVAFPNAYLQQFRIESIQPEPKESRNVNGEVRYIFEGSGDMDITFFLIPQKVGDISGTVAVNENTFSLNHFIYP